MGCPCQHQPRLAVTEQKVRLTGMRIDVSAEHGGVRAGLAEAVNEVRRARARQATAIFCEMRRLNCNAARRAPRMARQQRRQPRPLTIN